MKYLLAVCLFSLFAAKIVVGLQCYATDIPALKQGIVEHHTVDCRDNIRDMFQKMGRPEMVGRELPEDMLRCYKVVVYGDKTVEVKGCIVNKGCDLMKSMFAFLGDPAKVNIACFECDGNRCNVGSPGARVAIGALLLFVAMLFF